FCPSIAAATSRCSAKKNGKLVTTAIPFLQHPDRHPLLGPRSRPNRRPAPPALHSLIEHAINSHARAVAPTPTPTPRHSLGLHCRCLARSRRSSHQARLHRPFPHRHLAHHGRGRLPRALERSRPHPRHVFRARRRSPRPAPHHLGPASRMPLGRRQHHDHLRHSRHR